MLVTMLLSLQPSCKPKTRGVCTALTTPAFFFDENCGAMGRVVAAIKIAAARGARIQWLFVLNESRMNDHRVVHVMEHQKETVAEIPASARDNLHIGWFPMSPAEYRRFLRSQKTFLRLDPGTDDTAKPVVAIPDYASEGGRIIALRVFPDLPLADGMNKLFQQYWGSRNELDKYQHRK